MVPNDLSEVLVDICILIVISNLIHTEKLLLWKFDLIVCPRCFDF